MPTRSRTLSHSPRPAGLRPAQATDRRIERIDPTPLERVRSGILLVGLTVALSALVVIVVLAAVMAAVSLTSKALG